MALSNSSDPASQWDANGRKTEIRDIAAALFVSSGYAATTMSDIAQAAGVLPGSLYHHFASKEEIAVELIASYNDRVSALAHMDGAGLNAEEGLRELAVRTAELSMRHAAAVRLHSLEAPGNATARMADALAVRPRGVAHAWRKATDRVVQDAEPPVDAKLLAFSLETLTTETANWYTSGNDIEQATHRLCDLLLHGLALSAPEKEALDASRAMAAAVRVVKEWGRASHGPDEDRAHIIAAARTLFARRGYDATTIRDIADAAGVRMATLYRRVESKESMLREILTSHAERLSKATLEVHAETASPIETIDALAYLLIHATRRFDEDSDIVTFAWGAREMGTEPFEHYLASAGRRRHQLEDVIARGLADSTFRPIGTPAEIAVLVRQVAWLRFSRAGRVSATRAHEFVRRSVLRPTLG
jgi:AcrR family transcriptional regulator